MAEQLLRPSRRGFIAGFGALLAAPVVIKASALMPVRTPLLLRELIVTLPSSMQIGDTVTIIGDNRLYTLNEITREAVQLFKNSNKFLEQITEQCEKDFELAKPIQWSKVSSPRSFTVRFA